MQAQTQTWDSDALQRQEDAINAAEGSAIPARWESGRYLRSMKTGKQLPAGLRAVLKDTYKLSGSEVTARMKFAEKCPSTEQVVAVAATYKSWDRIRREFLAEAPKQAKPSTLSALERLLNRFLDFDQAELVATDEAVLTRFEAGFPKHLRRLRAGMKTLNVTGSAPTRKQRFPGGPQVAGELFYLLQTPVQVESSAVLETARVALAFACDNEGAPLDNPSPQAVERYTAEFQKHVDDLQNRPDYEVGDPIWDAATALAAQAVLSAGVR